MSTEPRRPDRGRGGRPNGSARRGKGGRQFGAQLTTEGTISAKETPGDTSKAQVVHEDPSLPVPETGPTAHNLQSKGKSKIKDSSDGNIPEEPDLCFICAEPFQYYALGVCSHRTCHICTIRMRALYKKHECTFCKTELPDVIFTENPSAQWSTFDLASFRYKDSQLSIHCETFQQLTDLLGLLKFNCPHPECSSILTNWKELKSHTASSHGLLLCDLCCANKKVFAQEHSLFTQKGLIVHKNQGSVGIGKGIRATHAGDQGQINVDGFDDGFKGHPKCEFCSTYFYDDDQLYKHCREKHEQCFICVRNESGRWQYYRDYPHLETHFRTNHHICTYSTCLQARFVVFETAFELQSHQIAEHGADMGTRAIKDARKIETNFIYSAPREQQAQTTIHGRAGGSGPHDQVIAMSIAPVGTGTASNLSDANRVVPGLGSNSRVPNGPTRRRDKSKFKSTLTVDSPQEAPSSSGMNGTSDTPNQGAAAAQNDPNLQRHAALMKRVEEAVGGSENKLTSFRAAVKMYRNNEMSASGFLDVLSTILDSRSEVLGGIVNHLLDLLDIDEDRKAELLKLWQDLRVEQNQFPSLDGVGSSRGPNLLANYSNLRGPTRGSTNWVGGVVSGASHFPLPTRAKPVGPSTNPLGREVPGLTPRPTKPGISATAWSGSGSASSSNNVPRVIQPKPPPRAIVNTASSKVHKPTEANFPGLPVAQAVLDRQSKVKELLEKSKTNYNSTILNNNQVSASTSNAGRQTQPGNGPGSAHPSSQPPGKKSKKVLLFTNSRPS
ncbi:hypothetical protein CROQUDRAFT_88755 [Cronartium quercuum f. sp. fusiforme G11]|uniref:RING-type E3 ubiquitin transferase n=1 Tax=Cronartium quercuum f. sp. fusiforme G11 TaxID=708437 RepID=A0A9P6NUE5_9BASI|nr:hypothetical protein CROQUDRAFT_88755 [Cronartium quercuum f. sp. fusiforme G11]